jgi:glycosyltransferase involved in cell wall biosynthesis
VKFFNYYEDKLDEFDIIHLFGLSPTTWEVINFLKKTPYSSSKVVLSPIYWPALEYDKKVEGVQTFLIKKSVFILRTLSKLAIIERLLNLVDYQYSIFKLADLILPNSYMEKKNIINIFKVNPDKVKVLYNGADKIFAEANPHLFESIYSLRDFVLYVGRIEPRKNVHNLIRAIMDTNLPLVIIGSPNPTYYNYYVYCQKLAEKALHQIKFIPFLPHDSEMLRSAYAASKVFVLPSWFETPGLAALEAALAGSTIVITSKGCTKEYFGSLAFYIDDPGNIDEIRRKIIEAYNSEKSEALKKRILNNYTWDKIAEQLLWHYKKCLST